jgi:hypothetical protein
MFKKEFTLFLENPCNYYASHSLVSLVNKRCVNCSHEHRKATKDEYTNNKLYLLKHTGCYLCNPKITIDCYSGYFTWSCENFIQITNHKLTKNQIFTFMLVCKRLKLWLPTELNLTIFKLCKYKTKDKKITRIDENFMDHCITCRCCSEKLTSINTLLTCQNHIIPRKPTRNSEDDLIFNLNYN